MNLLVPVPPLDLVAIAGNALRVAGLGLAAAAIVLLALWLAERRQRRKDGRP